MKLEPGNDITEVAPGLQTAGWSARWFADDSRFWKLAAIVLGGLNILRGVRMPDNYAATQALINYDHGLVKRGLFGATLGAWFHLERFQYFAAASMILMFLCIMLLVQFTLQAGVLRLGGGVAVALFCASYAVSFFVHLAGYLEVPLVIVTLALLLIRDVRIRFAAALPLCAVAVLLHEMFVIVLLPVVLFSFIVDAVASPESAANKRLWAMVGVLSLVSIAVCVRLAWNAPLSAAQVDSLSAEYSRRADFTVDPMYIFLLRSSLADNLRTMWTIMFRFGPFRILLVASAIIFAVTEVPLLVAALAVCRTVRKEAGRTLLIVGALVAGLAPLLMNVVATDTARWSVLACIDCYLVVLLLCRSLPVERTILPAGYRNAATLLMAISMMGGYEIVEGHGFMQLPVVTMGAHFFRVVHRLVTGT